MSFWDWLFRRRPKPKPPTPTPPPVPPSVPPPSSVLRKGGSQGSGPLGMDPARLDLILSAATDLGMTSIRLDIDWAAIESTRGRYDWSVTDQAVDAIRGYGAVTELEQAESWRQVFEFARVTSWVGPVFAYCVWDNGTDASDTEQNFGLLRHDFTRKAAFAVFAGA